MDDETICPELQGMILIEDTGKCEEKFWLHDRVIPAKPTISRSAYILAHRCGIADWVRDDNWGGFLSFEEDDGRAAVIVRTIRDKNGRYGPGQRYRSLIFATSEAFWIKMVLKYRGS